MRRFAFLGAFRGQSARANFQRYCTASTPTAGDATEEAAVGDPPVVADPPLEEGEVPVLELSPEERRMYYARSWGHGMCALCSEPVEDWLGHLSLPTHRARHMVCRSIASADRYSTMLTNMWHYLHFDAALIKEFDVKKDSTRRRRIHETVRFLFQHNVLLYSPYRFDETNQYWVRTADFGKCLLAGEAVVRCAVVDRVARLFPGATAAEMQCFTDVVMDIPAMAALYDVFELNVMLPLPHRRKHKLTAQMKRAMLLAMCGEMNWFVAKSRATDRAFNNTLFPPSDTLVVHVLCHHTIESMLLEVVHFYVQKILRETLPVWNDFRGRLPYIAGKISQLVKRVHPAVHPRALPPAGEAPLPEKANSIVIESRPRIADKQQRLATVATFLPKPIPSWKPFVVGHTPSLKQRQNLGQINVGIKVTTKRYPKQSYKAPKTVVKLNLTPLSSTKVEN